MKITPQISKLTFSWHILKSVIRKLKNRPCRRKNLQGAKFDYFNIKSWKARVNKIYKNVLTALTHLGFHLEHKINKYVQMFSKVYFFLAYPLSLLVNHVS